MSSSPADTKIDLDKALATLNPNKKIASVNDLKNHFEAALTVVAGYCSNTPYKMKITKNIIQRLLDETFRKAIIFANRIKDPLLVTLVTVFSEEYQEIYACFKHGTEGDAGVVESYGKTMWLTFSDWVNSKSKAANKSEEPKIDNENANKKAEVNIDKQAYLNAYYDLRGTSLEEVQMRYISVISRLIDGFTHRADAEMRLIGKPASLEQQSAYKDYLSITGNFENRAGTNDLIDAFIDEQKEKDKAAHPKTAQETTMKIAKGRKLAKTDDMPEGKYKERVSAAFLSAQKFATKWKQKTAAEMKASELAIQKANESKDNKDITASVAASDKSSSRASVVASVKSSSRASVVASVKSSSNDLASDQAIRTINTNNNNDDNSNKSNGGEVIILQSNPIITNLPPATTTERENANRNNYKAVPKDNNNASATNNNANSQDNKAIRDNNNPVNNDNAAGNNNSKQQYNNMSGSGKQSSIGQAVAFADSTATSRVKSKSPIEDSKAKGTSATASLSFPQSGYGIATSSSASLGMRAGVSGASTSISGSKLNAKIHNNGNV